MANLDGMREFNAERDLVVALQKVIDDYELTDMEVLKMLHRLLGVGISKVSGDCNDS